jgi:hypothetical protein
MKARLLLAGLAGATLLAGCVVENNPQPMPAPSQPAPPMSAQPAPPDVGFSPDVTNAAVDACRSALDAQTDGAVEVTGTEFSQANSAVYMVVGANRAPWQCLVSNDGRGAEMMFLGSEGGA